MLAKSKAYRSDADAEATVRAYTADFEHFENWCRTHGFTSMPASPDTVGAYLASSGEGYALSTLRRRVAAIAHVCRLKGYTLDTRARPIRGTIKGIARNHGEPSRRAAALTTEEVKQLCAVCDDSLTGMRDRALFLVGFAGALRRSELVGLDVGHVKWTDEGMILLIMRSKTDQHGMGAEIAIVPGSVEETCPVRVLKRWLAAAKISSGPIFRKVGAAGHIQKHRLKPDAVRQILLKRAAIAGITGTRREPISPHGLRAGFVTTAYKNGARDEEIMEHTRHRSYVTMRGYIRRAKLGNNSPTRKIDL
jgi:integrase